MVELIMRIPISRRGFEDFASWPHGKFGVYTVRSAYNLARTEKFFSKRCAQGHGECSDLSSQTISWKSIWAVNSPEKMKIIHCHMAHDCLPTGFLLKHRNITADERCVFCGRSKHVEHVFRFCPFARSVWASVFFEPRRRTACIIIDRRRKAK